MGDWQQRKDRPARHSLSYQTDDQTDPSCLFSRKKKPAATLNCMERQKGGGKKIVGPSCIYHYSVGMKYQTRARNAHPFAALPNKTIHTRETNQFRIPLFCIFFFFFCIFRCSLLPFFVLFGVVPTYDSIQMRHRVKYRINRDYTYPLMALGRCRVWRCRLTSVGH